MNDLEQAARSFRLYMNSDETEFMSFNQDGAISSLNGQRLKLVGQSIFLGSNILSTEIDINIRISKEWTDKHWLSIFTNSSARAGIFKRSLKGLNSVFLLE